MNEAKRPLPDWADNDPEIKDAKWISDDEILAFIEGSETRVVTVQLLDEDNTSARNLIIDGSKYSRDELKDAFDRINSIPEFRNDRLRVRKKVDTALQTPHKTIQ